MKLAAIIMCLFVSGHTAHPPVQAQREAQLVRRITHPERWTFRFDENPLLDYDKMLREPDTTVAIRFCSEQSLKIVLPTARRQVDAVRNFLEQVYGYAPGRLFILRAADCHTGNALVFATELWVIPRDASTPPAAEVIRSDQLPKRMKGKRNRSQSRSRCR